MIRVTLGLGPPHSRGVVAFVAFTPPRDSADRTGCYCVKITVIFFSFFSKPASLKSYPKLYNYEKLSKYCVV